MTNVTTQNPPPNSRLPSKSKFSRLHHSLFWISCYQSRHARTQFQFCFASHGRSNHKIKHERHWSLYL